MIFKLVTSHFSFKILEMYIHHIITTKDKIVNVSIEVTNYFVEITNVSFKIVKSKLFQKPPLTSDG